MFVKNVWYVAAFETEFDKPFIARRLLDVPVLMYRTQDGGYAAMEDLCPHRLVPLSLGKRVGDCIQCGYHGMRFAADGRCTEVPGQANVPSGAHVRTFPLVARHGFAWIWMGRPELADPALIPDVHTHASPKWAASPGYHHMNANFRLINDNLLDLSHETFVHARTIGNAEERPIATYPARVTVTADCLIRAHREMPHIDAPPFFAKVIGRPCVINRWQSAICLLPSIDFTILGVHPVETDRTTALVAHQMHLLTPETETSTHYFWAFVRNFRVDDAGLTRDIQKAIAATFDEDKVILDIQQKQLETYHADVPGVVIRQDEAPMRARRLLEKRLAAEQADDTYVVAPPPIVPEHSFAVLDEAA